MLQEVLADCAERVRATAAAGGRLRVRGGGTKDFLAGACTAPVLDMRAYGGVVDYAPSELYATVRAGLPLAEFEALLARHGQCLPFDPPHFPDAEGRDTGTVGGMVAAGLAGPGRAATGSVRDFVLGALVLNGRGELLRFGGEVMKNVAGYDVSRVLAGSWGGLGAICEVSLKVLPRPPGSVTLRFEMTQPEALARINAWAAQPLPLNASVWWRGTLAVRLRGAVAAVEAATRRLGGELIPEAFAEAFWDGMRDQRDEFFIEAAQHIERDGRALWRLSLPSTAPAIVHGVDTLVEWGGAQRWVVAEREDAALAEQAALAGGHAQRVRGGPPGEGLHTPIPPAPAVLAIQRRLRESFDPQGVFAPGRPIDFPPAAAPR
jgi:glycolate oxidase FAD binding subunit